MGHGEGHTKAMQANYIPHHINSFPLVNGNIQRCINSDSKVSCDLSSAYKEGSDSYKVLMIIAIAISLWMNLQKHLLCNYYNLLIM